MAIHPARIHASYLSRSIDTPETGFLEKPVQTIAIHCAENRAVLRRETKIHSNPIST